MSTAWFTSRASISRPSNLNVPTTNSRVGPLSVSGGGSKVCSGHSEVDPQRCQRFLQTWQEACHGRKRATR